MWLCCPRTPPIRSHPRSGRRHRQRPAGGRDRLSARRRAPRQGAGSSSAMMIRMARRRSCTARRPSRTSPREWPRRPPDRPHRSRGPSWPRRIRIWRTAFSLSVRRSRERHHSSTDIRRPVAFDRRSRDVRACPFCRSPARAWLLHRRHGPGSRRRDREPSFSGEVNRLAGAAVRFLNDAQSYAGPCRNRMNRSRRWEDEPSLKDRRGDASGDWELLRRIATLLWFAGWPSFSSNVPRRCDRRGP